MIDHIVEDFFKKISCIQIGGTDLGEPMLSPHFSYFVQKVKEHGVGLDMITNGTLINSRNAELIASSLTRILISVEGIGQNYKKIRGVDWQRVENGIKLLAEARDTTGRNSPLIICLQLCVFRDFREDYYQLIDFAKEAGIDLILARNFTPHLHRERSSSFLYFENEHNEFFSQLKQYAQNCNVAISTPPAIPCEQTPRKSFRRKACSLPFEVFGIQANGKIMTCCLEVLDLGYYSPGHQNVMDSWSSANAVRLRETVNSDNPLSTCRNCEAVNYNPIACRPKRLRLAVKELFLASELTRDWRCKSLAKRVQKMFRD